MSFSYHDVFHFGRAEAVARDVDDVIHPAGDLVVAILVPTKKLEPAWVLD